jgi:hypothetical protein
MVILGFVPDGFKWYQKKRPIGAIHVVGTL